MVFDYAIYDGQATLTDAIFTITKDGTEVYSSENDTIVANSKNTFTYPMEVETDDDSNFEVIIKATSGEDALIDPIMVAVNNSLGYSATAGAVLYINPRTRTTRRQTTRVSLMKWINQSSP